MYIMNIKSKEAFSPLPSRVKHSISINTLTAQQDFTEAKVKRGFYNAREGIIRQLENEFYFGGKNIASYPFLEGHYPIVW